MLTAEVNSQGKINIIHPESGLKSFLNLILQMDHLFSMVLFMVIFLLILFFGLLLYLQLKLRRKEKSLFDRLGTEPSFFSRLICAEWLLLSLSGLAIGYIASIIINPILLKIFDNITKG